MTDLPAGRDLDAAVEHALGVAVCTCERTPEGYSVHGYDPHTGFCWSCGKPSPRHVSTDPAAAIEALEAWANADDSRWFRIIRDDVFGRRRYIVELDASSDEWMAQAPTLARAAALALVATTQKESV